ncbi:MAG: glucodextranase DOMON-like domain-containing protein, partial [Ignisphaera sp.]
NPWNGPNSFSLQYIHIYVRTTNPVTTNRIFRKDTFGLNIEFREDYQWQYALLISPGWGEKPLVEGELSALYYSNGVVFVEDKDFKVIANLDENYVEVIVPRQLMPDWENIRYWRVIVFVTGWAGENPDRIRGFAPGGGEWIGDATKYAESAEIPRIAEAVLVGVLPKFYDMAVYSDEFPEGISVDQQYSWSKGFDPSTGSLAVIPPPKVPTVTVIQTITKAMTLTYTSYITETKFTLTSVYVKELDVATAVLVAVVSIAVGIIVGYLISRKNKC